MLPDQERRERRKRKRTVRVDARTILSSKIIKRNINDTSSIRRRIRAAARNNIELEARELEILGPEQLLTWPNLRGLGPELHRRISMNMVTQVPPDFIDQIMLSRKARREMEARQVQEEEEEEEEEAERRRKEREEKEKEEEEISKPFMIGDVTTPEKDRKALEDTFKHPGEITSPSKQAISREDAGSMFAIGTSFDDDGGAQMTEHPSDVSSSISVDKEQFDATMSRITSIQELEEINKKEEVEVREITKKITTNELQVLKYLDKKFADSGGKRELNFDELLKSERGNVRGVAASAFLQFLLLKSRNIIHLRQDAPYDSIYISKMNPAFRTYANLPLDSTILS